MELELELKGRNKFEWNLNGEMSWNGIYINFISYMQTFQRKRDLNGLFFYFYRGL